MLSLSPPETHQSVAKAAAGDHSMTPLQSSACCPRSLSDPAHGEALSHWYLMGVSYSAMPNTVNTVVAVVFPCNLTFLPVVRYSRQMNKTDPVEK